MLLASATPSLLYAVPRRRLSYNDVMKNGARQLLAWQAIKAIMPLQVRDGGLFYARN